MSKKKWCGLLAILMAVSIVFTGGALRPVLLLHIVERQCQIQPAGILRLAHCAPHHLQQRPQAAGPLDAAVKGHLAARRKEAEKIFAGGVLHLVERRQREPASQHLRQGMTGLRHHPCPRPQQQHTAGADQQGRVPAPDGTAAARKQDDMARLRRQFELPAGQSE